MFPLLYFAEEMIADMERRGLPFSVISDTLQGFDAEINDYTGLYGRPGMRIYISWFYLFISGDLLRIGRLNYQRTALKDPIRVYVKDDDVKILWDGALLHRGGMPFGCAGYTDEAGKFRADLE
ncbi:hypothetical protein RCJ22_04655, partial [Vibrio sp. FNV 38]|nr:hypothetical protein [Vibrio sp. FNV 38]